MAIFNIEVIILRQWLRSFHEISDGTRCRQTVGLKKRFPKDFGISNKALNKNKLRFSLIRDTRYFRTNWNSFHKRRRKTRRRGTHWEKVTHFGIFIISGTKS